MTIPTPVLNYCTDLVRNYQKEVMSKLSLRLSEEEGASAITTQAERDVIQAIKEYATEDCFNKRTSATVEIDALIGEYVVGIQFVLTASRWTYLLVPKNDIASRNFFGRGADQSIKSRVLAASQEMIDAALPWATMVHSLSIMDAMHATPGQICFYLPWLPRLLDLTLGGSDDDKMQRYQVVYRRNDKGANARFLQSLHKPKPISNYLTLTKDERAFLRQGEQALAQYALLAEHPLPTERNCFYVSITSKSRIATPFDGDFQHISTSLT